MALQAQVAELQRQLAAWQSERPTFGLKAMSVFTGSANGLDWRELLVLVAECCYSIDTLGAKICFGDGV